MPAEPSRYSQWPLASDVQARLASASASLRGDAAAQASRIADVGAAVAAEVARRTLRQFEPDPVPTTRYYDGTGAPSLEIDEFVEFEQAYEIGLIENPGYPLANVLPVYEQGRPYRRLIRGQGGLAAIQSAGTYLPVPTIFPAGRQNIQVTATFGYAATIPVDLWEAVACEIAYRLLSESFTTPQGRLKTIMKGDEKDEFDLTDATGWHARFEAAMSSRQYRRSDGRKLRSIRNPMT